MLFRDPGKDQLMQIVCPHCSESHDVIPHERLSKDNNVQLCICPVTEKMYQVTFNQACMDAEKI